MRTMILITWIVLAAVPVVAPDETLLKSVDASETGGDGAEQEGLLVEVTEKVLEIGTTGKAKQFNGAARRLGIPEYGDDEVKIRRVYIPALDGSAHMISVRRHHRTGRLDVILMSGSVKTAASSYLTTTHGRLTRAMVRRAGDAAPTQLDLSAAQPGYRKASAFWNDWLKK